MKDVWQFGVKNIIEHIVRSHLISKGKTGVAGCAYLEIEGACLEIKISNLWP